MRRSWFAIVSAVAFLALGANALQAQNPFCDSVSARCRHSCQANHCQGNDRVGVCIPSLQFLVLDRLSAAGDRMEQAMRGRLSPSGVHQPTKTPCSCAEPGCGIEMRVSSAPSCDSTHVFLSDRKSAGVSNKCLVANPGNGQGSISDMVPDAPQTLPTVTRSQEKPVDDSFGVTSRHETLIDAPIENGESGTPRLLPTPVSEQVSAPKFPDRPEPVSDIAEDIALPEVPALPAAEETTVPSLPQQPLPDILVDPFIDDLGQSKTKLKNGVALVSNVETFPANALREGEPKRLSPSQKGIIARELAAPKTTRIIFKRSFDEKIVP